MAPLFFFKRRHTSLAMLRLLNFFVALLFCVCSISFASFRILRFDARIGECVQNVYEQGDNTY